MVSAGQAVLRVARLGEKDAVLNVGENQVALIRANPKAVISLWAAPDKQYQGRVREIAAAADAATRTYQVKVAVAEADEQLRWGMSANVGFAGNNGYAQVMLLPMTSLLQTDDKSGAKPAVWVVGADQKVQLRAISIGRYGESGVSVSGGLNGGELVVVAGVHKLKAGQAVKPMAADAPPPAMATAGAAGMPEAAGAVAEAAPPPASRKN